MTQLTNRRSVMTLYSDPNDVLSHRVRVVLAEKGINYEIVNVNISEGEIPAELAEYNPYNTCPTLVDRDLALYDANIIIEYLDERFPHPPLMPVDPVGRAMLKMLMVRIKNDWDPLVEKLIGKNDKQNIKQRKELRDRLISTSPIFSQKQFFMSDEFTLIDCALAATLWRLDELYIDLPESAQPLLDYSERLFQRDAFKESISENNSAMSDFSDDI